MPVQIQQRSPDNPKRSGQRLTLDWVLSELVNDGLVAADVANPLQQVQKARKATLHPLIVVADQKWKDPEWPGAADSGPRC